MVDIRSLPSSSKYKIKCGRKGAGSLQFKRCTQHFLFFTKHHARGEEAALDHELGMGCEMDDSNPHFP
jgi:hypothetical protein